jgi:hypothetical protein
MPLAGLDRFRHIFLTEGDADVVATFGLDLLQQVEKGEPPEGIECPAYPPGPESMATLKGWPALLQPAGNVRCDLDECVPFPSRDEAFASDFANLKAVLIAAARVTRNPALRTAAVAELERWMAARFSPVRHVRRGAFPR